MATITEPTTRTIRRVRVGNDFERYAYLFMRLSGISLLLLAVGHVLIQLILNDVHNLTLQFVADQWDSWGWKAYDLLLLLFALPHGFNGLRNVLEDYIHDRRLMRAITAVLVVILLASLVYAAVGITLFDAAAVR